MMQLRSRRPRDRIAAAGCICYGLFVAAGSPYRGSGSCGERCPGLSSATDIAELRRGSIPGRPSFL